MVGGPLCPLPRMATEHCQTHITALSALGYYSENDSTGTHIIASTEFHDFRLSNYIKSDQVFFLCFCLL